MLTFSFFAKKQNLLSSLQDHWNSPRQNKKIPHHDKVIPINPMLQQLSGPKINNNSAMVISIQWNSIIIHRHAYCLNPP